MPSSACSPGGSAGAGTWSSRWQSILPIGLYMVYVSSEHRQVRADESRAASCTAGSARRRVLEEEWNIRSASASFDPTKLQYRPVARGSIQIFGRTMSLKPYQKVNTPLYLALGSDTSQRFGPQISAQTQQFAERAVEDPPVACAPAGSTTCCTPSAGTGSLTRRTAPGTGRTSSSSAPTQ